MVHAVTTAPHALITTFIRSRGTPVVKRSNRLVILVGLLLAALAFIGIVVVLNQSQSAQQQGPAMETVLVATEPIEIGEPVTPDKVEIREVQADAVVGTPFRDETQVDGQPALFAIPENSQVSQEKLRGALGEANVSDQLQPGERAISFVVDRVQGIDLLVQAGDSIDIVASINLVAEETDDVSDAIRSVKTVLQDKRVLYVSTSQFQAAAAAEEAAGEGQAPAPTTVADRVVIVIAGTDQDAEVLRFAQRSATEVGDQVASALSVTLRGPGETGEGDDTLEETTGITIEQLLTDYGLQIPDLSDITELQPDEGGTEEPAP